MDRSLCMHGVRCGIVVCDMQWWVGGWVGVGASAHRCISSERLDMGEHASICLTTASLIAGVCASKRAVHLGRWNGVLCRSNL